MPTADELNALARLWSVDPLSVFAFAGANRRKPNSQAELDAFVAVLQPIASSDGVDITIILGYLQESRASTSSIAGVSSQSIITWAKGLSYIDQNGQMAFAPLPGAGYPNGQRTPTPAPGASTPAPATLGGFKLPNIALPQIGGTTLVGGLVVLGLGYELLHRRRH